MSGSLCAPERANHGNAKPGSKCDVELTRARPCSSCVAKWKRYFAAIGCTHCAKALQELFRTAQECKAAGVSAETCGAAGAWVVSESTKYGSRSVLPWSILAPRSGANSLSADSEAGSSKGGGGGFGGLDFFFLFLGLALGAAAVAGVLFVRKLQREKAERRKLFDNLGRGTPRAGMQIAGGADGEVGGGAAGYVSSANGGLAGGAAGYASSANGRAQLHDGLPGGISDAGVSDDEMLALPPRRTFMRGGRGADASAAAESKKSHRNAASHVNAHPSVGVFNEQHSTVNPVFMPMELTRSSDKTAEDGAKKKKKKSKKREQKNGAAARNGSAAEGGDGTSPGSA